ncbi:hypothetical protein [Persicobacter diffluens]|uniref:Secreted protein n=1 Tax=Persicobacter diffluens TaxID=981 RepID=A0AAN4VV43_9BACT|nr:hypothetical protein PEDI_10680 [Persicobacter diffluens]
MKKLVCYLVLCVCLATQAFASGLEEGIYLSFEDFQHNRPQISLNALSTESQQLLAIQTNNPMMKIDNLVLGQQAPFEPIDLNTIWGLTIGDRTYIVSKAHSRTSGKNAMLYLCKLYHMESQLMAYTMSLKPRGKKSTGGYGGPSVSFGVGAFGPAMAGGISTGGRPMGSSVDPGYHDIKKVEYCLDMNTGDIFNKSESPKKLIKRMKAIDNSLQDKKINKDNLDFYLHLFKDQNPFSFSKHS